MGVWSLSWARDTVSLEANMATDSFTTLEEAFEWEGRLGSIGIFA